MALTGNYGGEIEFLYCGVVDENVVQQANGAQAIGRAGLSVELNKEELIAGVPDDCPLTLPRNHRELSDFAACNRCPHSIIDDGGMIEC